MRTLKEILGRRIRSGRLQHLSIKDAEFPRRDREMKKLLCFAFAFVLFAPVAVAAAMQAAQIVG